MDKENWAKLKQIFSEAFTKTGSEQVDFVNQACGHDSPEAKQIFKMLRAAEQEATDLDEVVSGELLSFAQDRFELKSGAIVGAYKVEELIGKGGMGNVYLAHRHDKSFEQKVAIKIINSGTISKETIERFETERQILASLQHSNIARLIDGGTTDKGLPYLVMEYVEGLGIIDYCQKHQLDLESRLVLFKKVCSAVNFAHQNLIVHRDIKPSNVMVNQQGEVKLLDFGIAKMLSDDPNADVTQQAQRFITPSNSPPEQINGQPITTRTDIYQLGALLYHLVSGCPLFNIESRIRLELEKAILEETPTKPSQILIESQQKKDQQWPISKEEVKGDLDIITLNALKKEPEKRYQSVVQLAEDIDRFINHYPIKAKADNFYYRLKKFVQRKPALSLVSFVFVVSLVGFIVAIQFQSLVIQQQKQLAESEAETANQVVDFMVDMFEKANPNEHNGEPLDVIELIDIASSSVAEKDLNRGVKIRLLQTLGLSYQKLGEYEKAYKLMSESVLLARKKYQEQPEKLAMLLYLLGDLEFERGNYSKAEALHRESLAAFEQQLSLNPENQSTIEYNSSLTLTGLGAVLGEQGRYQEALEYDQKALVIGLKYYGEESTQVGEIYNSIGHVLRNLGKFKEAKAVLQKGIKAFRNAEGDNQLNLAHSLNQLSRTQSFLKEYEEAILLAKEGLAIRQKVHQRPHPEIAASMGNLSLLLAQLKRYDEAVLYRQESLEVLKKVFGESHNYIALTYSSLGELQRKQGKYEAAIINLKKSLVLLKKLGPKDHVYQALPLTRLGQTALDKGQVDAALGYLKEAYQLREKVLGQSHWRTATTAWYLAKAHIEKKQFNQAKIYLEPAYQSLKEAFGDQDQRVIEIKQQLDKLLSEDN